MGNFNDGFWNLFIVVCTLGGIFAMYLLTAMNSRAASPRTTEADAMQPHAGSSRGDRPEGDGGGVETMGHVWDEDLTELNNPLPRWWVILFYATLVFGVFYLVLYPGLGSNAMLLGWTQVKEYEAEMARAEARYGPIYEEFANLPIEQVAADPGALRIGERLFASHCAVCHGSDAGGVPGFPNLRDDAWQWGGEPEQIRTSILAGRDAVMPGWRAALGGDAGVEETTAYVLSLAGRTADAAKAAAGKEKYDALCVACHGADGSGNPALGAPSFTDDVWLYGGSEADVRHSIAAGRQGRMPAHGELLGEARGHVLAAWVWSLSNR